MSSFGITIVARMNEVHESKVQVLVDKFRSDLKKIDPDTSFICVKAQPKPPLTNAQDQEKLDYVYYAKTPPVPKPELKRTPYYHSPSIAAANACCRCGCPDERMCFCC